MHIRVQGSGHGNRNRLWDFWSDLILRQKPRYDCIQNLRTWTEKQQSGMNHQHQTPPPETVFSLLPHYWCRNIKPFSSSHCHRSLLLSSVLMDEGNQAHRPLRKHISVYAALPSSLSEAVIYWMGASCHWWLIVAETVTHWVPAGFTLESCFTAARCWLCSPHYCGCFKKQTNKGVIISECHCGYNLKYLAPEK